MVKNEDKVTVNEGHEKDLQVEDEKTDGKPVVWSQDTKMLVDEAQEPKDKTNALAKSALGGKFIWFDSCKEMCLIKLFYSLNPRRKGGTDR